MCDSRAIRLLNFKIKINPQRSNLAFTQHDQLFSREENFIKLYKDHSTQFSNFQFVTIPHSRFRVPSFYPVTLSPCSLPHTNESFCILFLYQVYLSSACGSAFEFEESERKFISHFAECIFVPHSF